MVDLKRRENIKKAIALGLSAISLMFFAKLTKGAVVLKDKSSNTEYRFGSTADFSAAGLRLPQASPATISQDGEIELDNIDGTLVVQNSNGHTYLGSSTDVVYGKLLHSKTITIIEPDKVQAVTDGVPMFSVESDEFPHGIEIVQVYLKTSESSTYSVNLEKWATPTDGSPDTLTTIATSTSTEANEAPDTTGTVGTSEIIMLDLPDTDVNWIQLTVVFYEPIA